MAEQQTNPRPGSPRSYTDVAEGLNAFFPGQPEAEPDEEAEAPEALDEEQEDVVDPELVEGEYAEDDDVLDEDVSEDEDADPESEDTSGDFRLTLTVNGEEVVVEDEEEARSLAQRGKHYTQEMQQLREEQRQWESEKQAIATELQQEKQQYAAALGTLEETFGAVLGDEPDWNQIYQENPEQYAHLRAQWDQLQAVRAEKERIAREQQEEQQNKVRQWVEDQQAELKAKKPEWTDSSQREQDIGLIRDYAIERGVSEQELNNLYDHRFWLVLHDAARYRQAQSSGKKQAKAAKKKAKTAKPGSGKDQTKQGTRQYRQERKRLKDTGDIRAAGNILQKVLDKSGS